MKATAMKASRPDVELRLTAKEADALRDFCGNITLSLVETVMDEEEISREDLAEMHNTLTDIYEVLDDVNY